MSTKSRTAPFRAAIGKKLYTYATNYRGSYDESHAYVQEAYVNCSTNQTFISEDSKKYVETEDTVWDNQVVKFSYPRFKGCTNSKLALYFTPGIEFVHADYHTYYGKKQYDIFTTWYGNPPMADRLPTSLARCVALGYAIDPGTYASQVASKAAQVIRSKLLTDSSLLNFREVFSVLTFIAELGDIRSLPSLLKKWTKTSHDVSDKFLGVQFGVLPFFSDIKSIMDRLNNLGPAIDEWNRAAQECNIRAYHVTVPVTSNWASDDKGNFHKTVSFAGDYGEHIRLHQESNTDCVQSVKAKAHVYLIPRAIPGHLIDELKRNIWGLDGVLSTAWEKVPFSFVVDWFLKIGSIIEEFERQAPLLQYRVLSAGYSIKVDTVVTNSQGRSPDDNDFGSLTMHHTYYKRAAISPAGLFDPGKSYQFEFHTLNADQTILGTALLHQLLR